MKYLKAAVATAGFVVLMLLFYYLNVRYGRVDVVFYSAMYCSIAAAAIGALALVAMRSFTGFNHFETTLIILIWLLGGYAFAISVPTVIDRSLSFYILEKLDQRGGGIRQDRFGDVFTKEYMVEHRLVDVRLTEQLESGTITIQDGCVRLTDKGRDLAHASRYFRQNFLPKHRLLLGAYSDDLTDPFRHSKAQVDYQCR